MTMGATAVAMTSTVETSIGVPGRWFTRLVAS
jgi:hypothetical protein